MGAHSQPNDRLQCRWSVCQRGVRPDGIVVLSPSFVNDLGLLERVEDFTVKQFVAQLYPAAFPGDVIEIWRREPVIPPV
jgi:hypothetical protein